MSNKSINKIIDDFHANVPAFVTRKEAERLTGGLLNARSLANADCAGVGVDPTGVLRFGRRIAYTRQALCDYLRKNLEVCNES